MRAISVFSFLLNVAFSALLIYLLWSNRLPPIKHADVQGLEYKDFISILLTALAVMIAAATILIAVAAIWGFATIREEARSSAERVAAEIAKEVATEVATKEARNVAESVAARTDRTVTSPEDAGEIAQAMGEEVS